MPHPRRTQAQRRAATQQALLEAALETLVEEGYSSLNTASVCARAGLTRGAAAHYFATQADLVIQALIYLTDALVADLAQFVGRRNPEPGAEYDALLDGLWKSFSGPLADAYIELLTAARTDAELRTQMEAFERRVSTTLAEAASTIAPELVHREEFRSLITTALATIRGLRLLRATASERQVKAQWTVAKEIILTSVKPPSAPI